MKRGPAKCERLVGGALIVAMLPLAGTVDLWVVAVFCYVVVGQLIVALPLPPGGLMGRALMLGGGVGAIAIVHGTLTGLNAGLTLLGVLMTLKVLEVRSARDLAFCAHLALVLSLTGLFVHQELHFAVYQSVAVSLALAALLSLNAGQTTSPITAVRTAALVLVAGIPLAAVLFVFAPRTSAGLRWQFGSDIARESGLSDTLEPGSHSEVVLSSKVAFRAEFPGGDPPEARERYWRAGVLDQGDNFRWQPSRVGTRPMELAEGPSTRDVRQVIMLEPHGGRWLPALDRPYSWVIRASLDHNYVLSSVENVYGKKRYEVVSRLQGRDSELGPRWRAKLTEVPERLDPRVQMLATGLRTDDDEQTLRALLQHFQTGNYVYSLKPGGYSDGPEGLGEFLFGRREGFCEHYAAAFATLARAAGLPARVVTGYQGGELNAVGGYMVIRQSDAHAWCEVWTDNTGWLRVDPTLVVAPERIASGLAGFLRRDGPDGNGFSALAERSGLSGMLRGVRSVWDTLEYEWISRVVGFDAEAQRSLFAFAGLARLVQPAALAAICAVIVAAFVLGLRAWPAKRKAARPADPAVAQYRLVRRRLERSGVVDRAAEGPLDYALRARRVAPSQREWIENVTELYVRLRYAGCPPREREEMQRRLERAVAAGGRRRTPQG